MSWGLDQHHLYLLVPSCPRRVGRGVILRALKDGNCFHMHLIFDSVETLVWRPGPVNRACPVPWMVVGLEVWVCLPSLAAGSCGQSPAEWCERLAWCGLRQCPPPSLLCPQLLAPQRELLPEPHFWPLSHHCDLRLMFGFHLGKRAPGGTFQIFSLANSSPHFLSLQSEKTF